MWLKVSKFKIKRTKGEQPDYEVIDKIYQSLQFQKDVYPSSYTGPVNEYESGTQSNISPDPESHIYAKKK
jgi:hypothetical protein